jgi:Glycosyltransferase family 87
MVGRPPLTVIEGGGRPRPPFAAALEFAALGAGLTLTSLLMSGLQRHGEGLGVFQILSVVAFAFFGLALLRVRRYAALPHAWMLVLGVAVAARVPLILSPAVLSDDIYRYVWEGRVITRGGNPYTQSPDDPALAPLRDGIVYPKVNHRELATIYPPLAEAGFALVARVSPTVAAFKVWILLHEVALILVLMRLLRASGLNAVPVIAYAWNPLAIVEFAGSGHNDPTAMLWLAVALLALPRRPVVSAVALSAGALVKLAPLVALPFLARRWTVRARFTAVIVLGAGLGAFWVLTRGESSGLRAYWSRWRNNELIFHYLELGFGGFDAARAAALVLIGVVVAWALWKAWGTLEGTRLTVRAATLVGPVLHPWYLGWALMFEPFGPSLPWLLLSLTVTLNYGVFAIPAEGRDFHLPMTWRWVEYGVPLLAAVVLAWSRRRARAARP